MESQSGIALRCRIAAWFVGLLALTAMVEPARGQACEGDVTADGKVDGFDLTMVLGQWGDCPTVVTAFAPQAGSVLGGALLTIHGFNLGSTTAVKIGGAPCTDLQVISPTLLKAVTPAGVLGEASVTVESPEGTVAAPIPFSFVLQAINSVAPNYGPSTGGTSITIFGSHIGDATGVTIGGVPATNVLSLNANTVTAVTPSGTVGAAEVAVVTPKGTVVAPAAFTYGPAWCTLLEFAPHPLVVTNAALRNAIIATGLPWRVRDNFSQIEMVLVPPGSFEMGCSTSDYDNCIPTEFPTHLVTITRPFYLGRYEVTQGQWQTMMGYNRSSFQGQSDSPNRPVETVSWGFVQGFLTFTGMRLPTEAEWEYACRAGTTTAYHSSPVSPNGSNDPYYLPVIGWYASNAGGQTHVVGTKAANALGLHDMLGNVYEWVNDWWGDYSAGWQTDPTGPATGDAHVIRGGAWTGIAFDLRTSRRGGIAMYQAWGDLGFRVARNP